ncbi:MAG: HAMP domain-containing histidine kinase [Rhodocyclaceae bacterium]|nr:HAMP domain-containing histidine kinase [Rhodocyclaceae bacterium]MBX3667607.1 HAMP domain-containing histidine kinase [Rhodocyclaceae bacterium]
MKNTSAWVQAARLVAVPVARNWRLGGSDAVEISHRFFRLYRFAIASVFLFVVLFYGGGIDLGITRFGLFIWVAFFYWLSASLLVALPPQRPQGLASQLTLEVLLDIVVFTIMMHASGGNRSGLSFMILVTLAAAALVTQGRLILFFAASATLAVLFEQWVRALSHGSDAAEFVQAGIICIGFFATALAVRLLARRVIENERLARDRGVVLANQLRINERVIRDMQDGVLVVDRGGRVRQFNPQAARLCGASATQFTDLRGFNRPLADVFARCDSGSGEPASEVRLTETQSARVRLVPAGAEGDMLIYLEDLSQIQEQARQIKLAALGRLTANIAHEIRNPLAAISHAAELLREDVQDPLQTKLTRIIGDNVLRLDRLVHDVLELGRRDRIQFELIDLPTYLALFVEDYRRQDEAAGERLQLQAEGGARMWFDRGHLDQVLWNLVNNALRYASGASGAVRIAAESMQAYTRIVVADDGPGVPEDARSRLFEPFFTTYGKGTGLGLYIARELCDANRATLELVPAASGANFHINGKNETWRPSVGHEAN